MKANALLLTLVLSLGMAACGQKQEPESAATTETATPAAPMEATPAAPESAAGAGDTVDAQALYASRCASCHGAMGQGVADNPKLAGLSGAVIESSLKDYRDGKQRGPKTPIMASMAKPLTDAQISSLAGYLGE